MLPPRSQHTRPLGPRKPRVVRTGLARATAVAAMLVVSLAGRAIGQAPSAPPVADTVTSRTFRIPRLPLREAVARFREQSGLPVDVDSALARDRRSREVTGTFPPLEALRRLLEGTGLAPFSRSDRSIALRRSGSRVQTLAALEVVGRSAPRRGYLVPATRTATRTATLLRDVPQSITVITHELIADQAMQSMADVVRYMPGITMGQGEGNRDQPTIRGNNSTANFFLDGIRDDVQYFRDLYNVDRVEGLKGANALIFGRGVGGGVINRASKEPKWTPLRELVLRGGSYGTKRGSIDLDQVLSDRLAARFNGMYENSDQFRHDVNLERYGINPTLSLRLGGRSRLAAGYEHFSDHRTADRGIPSFEGGPAPAEVTTFFGDPRTSYSDARVDVGSASFERIGRRGLEFRTRLRFAAYDKIYQNVFPGAVDPTGALVTLQAYNNATRRQNLVSQTELSGRLATGPLGHTVVVGVDLGRQITDNFRNTGYFDGTTTAVQVPFASPTVFRPVVFRQSATDADNHIGATTFSLYAQDQIVLSSRWQVIAGVRYERFDLDFHNHRTGATLGRVDDLVSPRLGLLYRPIHRLTVYGSYSTSSLPSSGDQFSSLTATSATLEPERFTNYEVGAKWDLADRVSLTAAAYRLDRTNTSAPDPADPSRIVQTGSQRTRGFELGVSGSVTRAWQIAGGYANQDAFVVSQTKAAAPGAKVPLVARHSLSLWNRVDVGRGFGLGLGAVYQDRMFAAIDNTVSLPSFTRFDGAAYVTVSRNVTAQLNLENIFDRRYYLTSQSNNNISPGSPRAFRVSVTTRF